MKLREIRIRSIASCSSRDEFTLRLRNEIMEEEGETGREGPGNKESFTFFHFPRRIKGEEPWKEGKGRRRQKRNIVGKWKGIETLHARSPPPEAE